jgi:hypothetical protein
MIWARHLGRVVERRDLYRVLVGKREGKRPLRRQRRRWGIILRRIFSKWEGSMDWTYLAQDRDRRRGLVNAVMNFRVS